MKRVKRPLLSGTTVCYPTYQSDAFSLARALEGIASVGLQHVEIASIPGYCEHVHLESVNDAEIARIEGLLRANGLTPIAINAAADLTTDAGVERLALAAQLAEGLGVGIIVTAAQRTADAEGLANFRARASRMERLAEKHNVIIALETHKGHIGTGARGVALLRALDAQRLKLTWDMANVYNRGGVLPEVDLREMRAMGDVITRYIAHVHIKEKGTLQQGIPDFPVFGTGVLDFGTVLTLLEEYGYTGAMSAEVELDGAPASPELIDDSTRESLAYLERFWQEERGNGI